MIEQLAQRNQRREAHYRKLLADSDFQDFILKEWFDALVTEMAENLTAATDPVQCLVAKEKWLLATKMRSHLADTVEVYRQAEAQRLVQMERIQKRRDAGLPPESDDE
jgi:hypothetical protein